MSDSDNQPPPRVWLPRRDSPYVPNAEFYIEQDHDDDIPYVPESEVAALQAQLDAAQGRIAFLEELSGLRAKVISKKDARLRDVEQERDDLRERCDVHAGVLAEHLSTSTEGGE